MIVFVHIFYPICAFSFCMIPRPPRSTRTDTLCPDTTPFRSVAALSSNENPFGTPEAAAAAYVRESGTLHRYPYASAAALREALAAKYGLDPAREIGRAHV